MPQLKRQNWGMEESLTSAPSCIVTTGPLHKGYRS